jgi:hypothetical protein
MYGFFEFDEVGRLREDDFCFFDGLLGFLGVMLRRLMSFGLILRACLGRHYSLQSVRSKRCVREECLMDVDLRRRQGSLVPSR